MINIRLINPQIIYSDNYDKTSSPTFVYYTLVAESDSGIMIDRRDISFLYGTSDIDIENYAIECVNNKLIELEIQEEINPQIEWNKLWLS